MTTQRALRLKSKGQPLILDEVSIPKSSPGPVVVKILGTFVLSYLSSVLQRSLPYPVTLPLTSGESSIGRVHSAGLDGVSLEAGQLGIAIPRYVQGTILIWPFLMGLHGGAAMKLTESEWRHETFMEYAKFPFENVFALDEMLLCGELGDTIDDYPTYLASQPALLKSR
jgi:hypothetical protein